MKCDGTNEKEKYSVMALVQESDKKVWRHCVYNKYTERVQCDGTGTWTCDDTYGMRTQCDGTDIRVWWHSCLCYVENTNVHCCYWM